MVASDPQLGLKLTERSSLISTERVRVRTVILLCPLTSQVLIGQTFGPKRMTDELASMWGEGRVCICLSPDWSFTFRRHSDGVGKGW